MHHFIFPTKDTWISSGSSTITGESFKDQNFGRDQILEVKKFFYNNSFDHQTRALIDFSGTDFNEMSQSIMKGDITEPKFYLKLYEAEGNSELSEEYKLHIQPISQSWTEGTGKFSENPKNTNGCSWENLSNPIGGNETTWSSGETIGDEVATGTILITTGSYDNQQFTIGNVDFLFVNTGSDGYFNFNNSAHEFYILSASSPFQSAKNVTEVINNSGSLHNLQLSASAVSTLGGATSTITISSSLGGAAYNYTFDSSSTVFSVQNVSKLSNVTEGGTDIISRLGGDGPSVLRISSSVQSFSNESPDVNVEVTDMVNGWLSGSFPNYGMQLRFSGSQETDSSTFGHLKFFSRNTHTIYSPKLEVRWEDSSFNTGDLTELSMSGLVDNYLYMRGLRESYKENDRVKFRVGARKRYIQKSFSTSVHTTSGSYIPQGSGSYAIKDVATGEFVVPFSAHTSMSCDAESPYFIQWLDGFYPDRAYKVLLKLKYNDGQEQVFDDDFEFVIKRS